MAGQLNEKRISIVLDSKPSKQMLIGLGTISQDREASKPNMFSKFYFFLDLKKRAFICNQYQASVLSCKHVKVKFKQGTKLQISIAHDILSFFYKGEPFIRVQSEIFKHKVFYFSTLLVPTDSIKVKKIVPIDRKHERPNKIPFMPYINYDKQLDAIINPNNWLANNNGVNLTNVQNNNAKSVSNPQLNPVQQQQKKQLLDLEAQKQKLEKEQEMLK